MNDDLIVPSADIEPDLLTPEVVSGLSPSNVTIPTPPPSQANEQNRHSAADSAAEPSGTPAPETPATPPSGDDGDDGFVGEAIDYSSLIRDRLPGISDDLAGQIKTADQFHAMISASSNYHSAEANDPEIRQISDRIALDDVSYLKSLLKSQDRLATSQMINERIKGYMFEDGSGLSEEGKQIVDSWKASDEQSIEARRNKIWEQAQTQARAAAEFAQKMNTHIDTFNPKIKAKLDSGDFETDIPLSKKARYELVKYINTGGIVNDLQGDRVRGENGHEHMVEFAMWANPLTRTELLNKAINQAVKKSLEGKR